MAKTSVNKTLNRRNYKIILLIIFWSTVSIK